MISKLLMNQKAALVSAAENVSDFPVFAVPPVLHDFCFVGTHSLVEIYFIFRFELMPSLSFRLFRSLKECILNISQMLKETHLQLSIIQESQSHFSEFQRWS